MCFDKEKKPFLVGISSHGQKVKPEEPENIDKSKYPDVFTHVLKYNSWISDITNEEKEGASERSDSMKPSYKFFLIMLTVV